MNSTFARTALSYHRPVLTIAEQLEVSDVPDGLVVYDPTSDRVHYLDPVSTVVFELCRSGCAREDLPARVQQIWELDEPPTSEVETCVEQCLKEGLLRSI
jgi:hypothetical protein